MSRQQRLAKTQVELRALEEAFAERLCRALQSAAKGEWGLFGGYANVGSLKDASNTYHDLHSLGCRIEDLRRRLGMTGFNLYVRYCEYCKRHRPNDPGEPRLAQEFLAELERER